MVGEDDNYRRSAEVVYDHNTKMHEFCIKMQADYGKWLISSLLFLHGAAIGGLLFKAVDKNPPPYLFAVWWFVIGTILALAAGFSAWWNFTFLAERYNKWADYRMLTDRAYWPESHSTHGIDATLWIAVVTGVLSVACLLGGALSVACTWHPVR